MKLWHRRLGHLNRKDMSILENNLVTGLDFSEIDPEPCVACIEGKQRAESHFQKFKGSREQKKN